MNKSASSVKSGCVRGMGGDGLLLAKDNATYYNNNISAKRIGVTRVGFETVLSITL